MQRHQIMMAAFFIAQDAEAEEEEEIQTDKHEQGNLPEESAATKQDPKQRLAGRGVLCASAGWCCTLHSFKLRHAPLHGQRVDSADHSHRSATVMQDTTCKHDQCADRLSIATVLHKRNPCPHQQPQGESAA